MIRRIRNLLPQVAGVLLAAALAGQAQTVTNEQSRALDDLLVKMQKTPDAVSAEEVGRLLQLSRDLGRPCSASVAVRSYLASRINVSPELLRAAAENAMLAGDFRTAATRYKQYLKPAAPSPESCAAAATLYRILIDFLNASDDAFQFMNEFGDKFRQDTANRKFDSWFLTQAQTRRACPAMARRLALVFGDQLPIEQERLLYWEAMDWLMAEISQARPEHFDALPHWRRLATLIRESPRRVARANFYAANLGFRASAGGKETSILDKEYDAVVAAARAYFDAFPTAETLQDVLMVFGGGYNQWRGREDWNRQVAAKLDFFAYGFSKISDADREGMMRWRWGEWPNLIPPERWAALGAQYPDLFRRSTATAGLPFVISTTNLPTYKAQAAFLQGVPSLHAAIINSVAASDDYAACIQHLAQQECAFLAPGDISQAFSYISSAHANFPRADAQKLPPDYYDKANVRLGAETISKSPLAFLTDVTAPYASAAFRASGQASNDKTKVAEHFHNLDWVPYTVDQRKAVFTPAYDEYKRWAEDTRKVNEAAKKTSADAAKAVETANKAKADLVRLTDENQKALDAARKARDEANQTLENTKKAQADAAKAKADAEAALNAAKAANDNNKVNEINGTMPALAKAVNDLAPKLPQATQALQDLNNKLPPLEAGPAAVGRL